MRLFAFGLGYAARRILARLPGVEASGATREAAAAAAWRSEGVAAFGLDDAAAPEILAADLRSAEALLISAPPGDEGDPALVGYRSAFAAASNLKRMRLSLQRQSLWRLRRRPGSMRRPSARRIRAAADGGWRPSGAGASSHRRRASRSTFCGSPAFTDLAAARSKSSAPAKRGGSSSRGRSSTASMSTISPRSRRA